MVNYLARGGSFTKVETSSQPYILESSLEADDFGYRKWSDGLLEVWGYDSQTALYSTVTIPFNLEFRDFTYHVQLTWYYGSNKNIGNYAPYVGNRTTTTFTICHDSAGAQQLKTFYFIRGRWK